ncbi:MULTISPECIES: enoyl-CoA hydratase/isomerase family protein [Rhodococcus]|jgi:enoyl-CoA hydratase|uniref:enoyl-CoA hydratase/isomerase family protein n=1 Tax=Rhodococcus TaxID=1827 RepID=UPI001A526475|nr:MULTISPECIES: enoyl-CoA hydratase/isomerase family protein [Rhodococcus]ULD45116.1 enoyl-CoA hydratase/isomerase family protein [Rhodococcus qingshengii]
MSYRYIRVEHVDRTAVITVNNPPVNALHPDVSDEIRDAAENVEADHDVRSMILTGEGRCFIAGGDIKLFTSLDREGAAAMALRTQRMQHTLFDLRVPVIAALNGHALGGGCEVMFACDITIADPSATIGLTEVKLGLIPGAGGTQMITKNLPPGTAKRMLFTGDRVTAAEALRLGLIDEVSPAGKVLDAALALASRINSCGPLAVEAAKKSANFELRHSEDAGHLREVEIFSALFDSSDHREGLAAFLGKRPAQFERS